MVDFQIIINCVICVGNRAIKNEIANNRVRDLRNFCHIDVIAFVRNVSLVHMGIEYIRRLMEEGLLFY